MISESPIGIFVDALSKADISVIALVAEDEFALARVTIPEWSEFSSYEEWLDSREGFQMGLTMAGVDVRMVPIVLSAFLVWCRHTQTQSSAGALETFAGLSCNLTPKQGPAPRMAIYATRH
jgi:hypothetical protein